MRNVAPLKTEVLRLNDEFVEYRWIAEDEIGGLELNEETVDTLERLGSWKAGLGSNS
jgi:hypothetical protein